MQFYKTEECLPDPEEEEAWYWSVEYDAWILGCQLLMPTHDTELLCQKYPYWMPRDSIPVPDEV